MGRRTVAKQEQFAAKEALIEHALSEHNLKQRSAANDPDEKPLVHELVPYLTHAIRDPFTFTSKLKSSNRSKKLLELVRYTFNKYPVNAILSQVWTYEKRVDIHLTKFRQWYVCVATGGSFYKEFGKDFFTKKEAHLFLNCSYELSIVQARVYAVAKAAGAKDGQALRLAKSKLCDKHFTDFWCGVVRYFAVNEPPSISVMNDLVDYVAAKKNENANFTLFGAGHTIPSLLVKMEEWHRALQRTKILGDIRWTGFPIDDFSVERKDIDGHDVIWKMTQILDTKTLAAEGSRMRHCVLSYKNACLQGTSSIWQLTLVDYLGSVHHKATIEVRKDGSIVQARGLANRNLRSEEQHVMHLWAAKSGLYVSKYL